MASSHDWVWEAFSLYDTLYSYMPPFIIRMNTKAQKLNVEHSKLKRLLWCFSIFLNVFIIAFSCSLYVVVKWGLNPKCISVIQAAAALGVFTVSVLVGYTCTVHYIYREEHVLGCNVVLELHLSKTKGTSKRRKITKRQKAAKDMKQVILGRTMKGMVWGFWCIPAIVPIAIFEGIDPLRTVLLDLVPLEWMNKYPIHVCLALALVRLLLCSVAAMEVSRFLAMFFLLFISGIIIYVDCIDKFLIDKTNSSSKILTYANFYDLHSIRLVVQILNPVMLREICCLMFSGFVIAVGSNVAIVQCFDIFPWYVYYTSVLIFIITMIIIYCTLPFGTDVNEKTALTLEKWRSQLEKCNPSNLQVMRRILRSLRPISVRCGPFFKLKRETKSTYFDKILTTSCDCNITLDIKSIFENGL